MLPVPVSMLKLGGRALKKQGEIERLVGSLRVATQNIQTSLAWSAPYAVQEGLEETVDWFKAGQGRSQHKGGAALGRYRDTPFDTQVE